MAPPTPQRAPTGRPLSSSVLPCANNVLRPSDCHLEVAPTTTATCLPFEFVVRFWFIGKPLPLGVVSACCVIPDRSGADSTDYWRIYCCATKRGRTVDDEVVTTLNAGNADIAPD